jgi:hypothetical protein
MRFDEHDDEWIKALNTPKTAEAINDKYEELRDRVWYQRTLMRGRVEGIFGNVLEEALKVEKKYADRTLYGKPMLEWDQENYHRLEGWMAAIMWASSGMDDDEAVLYDT